MEDITVGERGGQSTKALHEILARAQEATSGVWRPVGRSVMSGDIEVAEAKVWMHGTPAEARHNANYLTMLAPTVLNSIVNELLGFRRAEKDLAKDVEANENRLKKAEDAAEHARALVAAVTLPSGSTAEELVNELARKILVEAPHVEASVVKLKAIALANVQDVGTSLSGI